MNLTKAYILMAITLLCYYRKGLLTAPGNSEMTVAIWGYAEDNRTWKIHVIDFEKVITKNCKYTLPLSILKYTSIYICIKCYFLKYFLQ